jgi:hypothetical protein
MTVLERDCFLKLSEASASPLAPMENTASVKAAIIFLIIYPRLRFSSAIFYPDEKSIRQTGKLVTVRVAGTLAAT